MRPAWWIILLLSAALSLRAEPARAVAAPRFDAITADVATPEQFAAALLAETNRVRREHGRKPLTATAALNAAADDQASFMSVRLKIDHLSAIKGQKTPAERAARHGVRPTLLAENVASMPLPKGEPAETVQSLVARFLAAWMDSPSHRAHLLNPDLARFGGSIRLARGSPDQWWAFGVQLFTSPDS